MFEFTPSVNALSLCESTVCYSSPLDGLTNLLRKHLGLLGSLLDETELCLEAKIIRIPTQLHEVLRGEGSRTSVASCKWMTKAAPMGTIDPGATIRN